MSKFAAGRHLLVERDLTGAVPRPAVVILPEACPEGTLHRAPRFYEGETVICVAITSTATATRIASTPTAMMAMPMVSFLARRF